MSPASARRRSSPMLIGGLVLVLGCVTGGAVMRQPGPVPWQGADDWWAARAIASVPLTSISELAALALAALVGVIGAALVAVAAVVLAVRGQRVRAGLLVVTPLVVAGVVALLKVWVARGRPEDTLMAMESLSYPSGHSAHAAALAVVVMLIVPPAARRQWWPFAVVLVLAMMASRTHLGVHWLSDTIAGAALGAGLGFLLGWAAWPWLAPPSGMAKARDSRA